MKKHLSIIVIIIIFFLGICICLYPTISTYINRVNSSYAIKNANRTEEKCSKEELSKEKEAVDAYNASLVDNHIVLTDPFDEDAFPITDGNYEELLADTEIMAEIEIPKINVDLPIYHGTNPKTLQKGVGHLENTSLPMGGPSCHTVLSAHTGLPSQKLFTDIDLLDIGDIFYITVLTEKLSYQVDQIKVVSPKDSSDLLIVKNQDYVTLVTCTPYGKNTHRLLVRGKRIENEEAKQIEKTTTKRLSFLDKILMKYGISLRELIVFICIVILTIIFIIVLLMYRRKGKKRA